LKGRRNRVEIERERERERKKVNSRVMMGTLEKREGNFFEKIHSPKKLKPTQKINENYV
jgi:hypothetical protein